MCKQSQQLSLCSPKLLKMPAGLHTSRRCAQSAVWLLSLALARRGLAGISSVFVKHTHQTREEVPRKSQGVDFCQVFFNLLLT